LRTLTKRQFITCEIAAGGTACNRNKVNKYTGIYKSGPLFNCSDQPISDHTQHPHHSLLSAFRMPIFGHSIDAFIAGLVKSKNTSDSKPDQYDVCNSQFSVESWDTKPVDFADCLMPAAATTNSWQKPITLLYSNR
jgi:hypothetical protein